MKSEKNEKYVFSNTGERCKLPQRVPKLLVQYQAEISALFVTFVIYITVQFGYVHCKTEMFLKLFLFVTKVDATSGSYTAIHSTKNISQCIKLDCKRVESDAYMQKLTHFSVSKNDITKFLWGDLGAWPGPHNFLAVGAIATWSRRL